MFLMIIYVVHDANVDIIFYIASDFLKFFFGIEKCDSSSRITGIS